MKTFLSTALALFAAGCVVGHCVGCAPAAGKPAIPAYCTNEVTFTAALVRCVDKSSTREESRACRKQVHAACGIVETVSSREVLP